MPSSIVSLKNITYAYYGREPILRELEFTLEPDIKTGLIGPNGSGKTTLFHIIMGLKQAHAGEVRFNGKLMNQEKDFSELRQGVGFLFQQADDQLFCPTVLEDVAFGPLNLGKTPRQAKAIAKAMLKRLGLEGYEERVAYNLSGGEKKLVALACVLAMEPQALLLDEPTNDLDPSTREHLIHVLNDLQTPYCIISHDWDFLSKTTHSLQAMEHGRVVHKSQSTLHTHAHVHSAGDVPHQHGGC